MNKIFKVAVSIVIFVSLIPLYGFGQQTAVGKKKGKDAQAVPGAGDTASYSPMPAAGNKVLIGEGHYFVYGFDRKPKLGTVIMKVEMYSDDGKRDTSLRITADAGMPSMKGAHETGDRPFVLSKKGDYLLPISIVMPGDWEIRLTVLKKGKVIFRGRYNFDV